MPMLGEANQGTKLQYHPMRLLAHSLTTARQRASSQQPTGCARLQRGCMVPPPSLLN